MNICRFRILKMFLLGSALLMSTWNATCTAADNAYSATFKDTVYGGLAGLVAGAVLMAFTRNPSSHLDYMAFGAAGGAVAGGAYGFIQQRKTRPLAEIEDGKVKLSIPTIIPDFQDKTVKGKPVVVTTEIFRGSF